MTKQSVRRMGRPPASRRCGMTFAEILAVVLLAGALMVIATLSIYRGKSAADELACHDHMQAIRAGLEMYWMKSSSLAQNRAYPTDQAAFEQFLQNPTYFSEEPRCPLDEAGEHHYQYDYDPATNPGPEGITITCPVAASGHGSL